jgi:K+-transporting ATPase A subunit
VVVCGLLSMSRLLFFIMICVLISCTQQQQKKRNNNIKINKLIIVEGKEVRFSKLPHNPPI